MSDVTDLKAEVLLLRKENKELRADQAHWELGNCPSCPNIADLQEALEQNGKLRELVRYMWDFSCVVPDEPHTSKEELDYSVEVWKRMRELGVDV